MAEYDMFRNLYTPEEVAQMKAQLEQSYQNAAAQNQNLSTAASMTKNLNPMANLGILLGTVAGKWGAQRLNDIFDKQVWNTRSVGSANPADWTNPLEGKYQPKYYGAGLPEGGVYANQLPNYFPNTQFYSRHPYNPSQNQTVQNPAPSTALNPPPTFFANETPYYDWRNQNYLSHTVTRPLYLSIR